MTDQELEEHIANMLTLKRIDALEAERDRMRGALEWVRKHGGYAHRDNIRAVAVEALLPPAARKGEGE